jgi:hypothetical protein
MRFSLKGLRTDLQFPRLLSLFLSCISLTFLIPVFLFSQTLRQPAQSSGVNGLVELYGTTSVVILYGDEDENAATLLRDVLQPHFKNVKILKRSEGKIKKGVLVIYLGSFASNPPAGEAFKSAGYSLDWNLLTEGSYLLKTTQKAGNMTVFVAGKDRVGTIYGTNDLKNYYFHFEADRVLLNELNLVERAQLKLRWFYHSPFRVNGILGNQRSTGAASNNEVSGSNASSLEDLKGLVEFTSAARVNGLLVKGLFELSPGGSESIAEFCKYAMERGVRVIPVVTLGGGEGFLKQAGHPFGLASRVKSHPELCAVGPKGDSLRQTLCPSKSENQNWYREGLRWLHENFRFGGIHFDTSELRVCYCEDCKKARARMKGKDSDYFKDLARTVSFVAGVARSLDAGYWISYATGAGFNLVDLSRLPVPLTSPTGIGPVPVESEIGFPPAFPQWIPEDTIAVWNLASMLEQQAWPSPFKAPAKHNIGQWDWGSPLQRAWQQLYFKRSQELIIQARSSNLEGLVVPVGRAVLFPVLQIDLLAFAEFAYNPATDPAFFIKTKLSWLYGGLEAVQPLSKLLGLLEDENGMQPQNKSTALEVARQALESVRGSDKERWRRLITDLENWETP